MSHIFVCSPLQDMLRFHNRETESHSCQTYCPGCLQTPTNKHIRDAEPLARSQDICFPASGTYDWE